MPLEVTQQHKVQYAASVELAAQQLTNPLANTVTVVPANGEAQSAAEYIQPGSASTNPERGRENPENPAQGTRRWLVRPRKDHSGQYIDEEDKFDRATDPTSIYVRHHTVMVQRKIGDRMLGISETAPGVFSVTDGGILGIAREGKTPGVGTELPASQYLANGGAGLTLDKLIAAKEKLHKADFGLDAAMGTLYCAITPSQITNLLNLAAEAKVSLNAFQIQQLQDGMPTSLLGITWVFTNRLPIKTGTADVRLCPIWAKENIIYGQWAPLKGEMWNDPGKQNLPYVYVSARGDCVRAQDKGVVVIEAKEAA